MMLIFEQVTKREGTKDSFAMTEVSTGSVGASGAAGNCRGM